MPSEDRDKEKHQKSKDKEHKQKSKQSEKGDDAVQAAKKFELMLDVYEKQYGTRQCSSAPGLNGCHYQSYDSYRKPQSNFVRNCQQCLELFKTFEKVEDDKKDDE